MKRTPAEMTPERALARLEDMCSRAEHCEGEAREKLRRWGIASAVADKIIMQLVANRYIDDGRFARAFALDKMRFGQWGTRKIRMALAAKHVDADIVAEALDEIDPDEYFSVLLRLVRAKLRSRPSLAESYEGRAKLHRALLARGYESPLITRALRSVISDEE